MKKKLFFVESCRPGDFITGPIIRVAATNWTTAYQIVRRLRNDLPTHITMIRRARLGAWIAATLKHGLRRTATGWITPAIFVPRTGQTGHHPRRPR